MFLFLLFIPISSFILLNIYISFLKNRKIRENREVIKHKNGWYYDSNLLLHPLPNTKKHEYGILYIPGFGCYPKEVDFMIRHLDKNIEDGFILACGNTGWDDSTYNRLHYVSHEQNWLNIYNHFLLLKKTCKSIILISHSTGSLYASRIMKKYEVHLSIFISPNFVSPWYLKMFKPIATFPVFKYTLPYIIPYIPIKPVAELEGHLNMEWKTVVASHNVYPLWAIIDMWELQNKEQKDNIIWRDTKGILLIMDKKDFVVGDFKDICDFINYKKGNNKFSEKYLDIGHSGLTIKGDIITEEINLFINSN